MKLDPIRRLAVTAFFGRKRTMGLFSKLYNYFSSDLAIDLGTANTLVYMQGKGNRHSGTFHGRR